VGVDGSFIYLPFEEAQLLCGMAGAVKRVSAIHIKFKSNVKLADGCGKIAAMWKRFVKEKKGAEQAGLLDTVTVQSWKEYRRTFIAAMEKEQIMLTIMFVLVGVTTVFIVLVVFYMIVSHKSKDIGILKSIGVSRSDIVELFSCFAFLIGLLGSAAGVFGGWLFLLKINRIEGFLFEHFGFQLWDRTLYVIEDIPNAIDLKVLAVIIASAIVACLAGAFLPSRQAARLEPVETLQVSQL
jgi:lipoprotein-releasing system permease protein